MKSNLSRNEMIEFIYYHDGYCKGCDLRSLLYEYRKKSDSDVISDYLKARKNYYGKKNI